VFLGNLPLVSTTQVVNLSVSTTPAEVPAVAFFPAVADFLALQRQNAEISKQIFPEKEYRGCGTGVSVPISTFMRL
jgi:hypothetical protein